MTYGYRVFIVDEQGQIKRISMKKYKSLLTPGCKSPEYANRRLQYASVLLEVENRRPVEIKRVDFGTLYLDSQGGLDPDKRSRDTQLFARSVNLFRALKPDDPRIAIAKLEWQKEYLWEPTDEQKEAIVDAIFGK